MLILIYILVLLNSKLGVKAVNNMMSFALAILIFMMLLVADTEIFRYIGDELKHMGMYNYKR